MSLKPPNSTTTPELVRSRVQSALDLKRAVLSDGQIIEQIARVGATMSRALSERNRILLFGNGGSAADAQHIAAELVGRFLKERRALPAIALTVNSSVVTAISNDYDFDAVFERQVEAFGQAADVAIGISTSGNSPNVLRGIEMARTIGAFTVGLTGSTGGGLRDSVDECICVPSTDTQRIQEVHILVGHILCEIVERELFPDV